MPEQIIKITKTQRILSIYHLLTYCEEVSMQEIANLLSGSKKTFSRDIALLKKAGVQVRYSAEKRAFELIDREHGMPDFPESKSEMRYIKKIIRLIMLMDDIPEEDCDIWYMETIPGATRRTMQRDFATLNSIGFRIKYEREIYNMHDAGIDVPPNHYYCDIPKDKYSLSIFKK